MVPDGADRKFAVVLNKFVLSTLKSKNYPIPRFIPKSYNSAIFSTALLYIFCVSMSKAAIYCLNE